MIGSNTRDYKPRHAATSLYRRSLYTFWKRAAPPASMDIFNAPSREICTVRRERTNTPLQALVTLNDPQFVEAARHLAERTLEGRRRDAGRPARLPAPAAARPPAPRRGGEGRRGLARRPARPTTRPTPTTPSKLITVGESKPDPALDPATLAAWTMLANELMNLDEVLNK